MKSQTHGHGEIATLDLAISDMNTQALEERAAAVLRSLHGVHQTAIIERGANVHYYPAQVSPDRIIQELKSAGLKATLFQDSATGKTGTVKF